MGKSLGGWGVWEERKQGEPPAIMYKRLGLAPVVSVLSSPTPPARLSRLRRFLFRSICPFSVPIFLSLRTQGRERKYRMGTEKIGQDAKRKRRRPIWSLSWVSDFFVRLAFFSFIPFRKNQTDKRNPRRWKTGPQGPGKSFICTRW
jgi:hypothetical protein